MAESAYHPSLKLRRTGHWIADLVAYRTVEVLLRACFFCFFETNRPDRRLYTVRKFVFALLNLSERVGFFEIIGTKALLPV